MFCGRIGKYHAKLRASVALVAVTLLLSAAFSQVMRGSSMTVIAPSIATREVARSVMRENGWFEAQPKRADGVLVVVRSSLYDPLIFSTRGCFCDLKKAAERQPNYSNLKFHIYVFRLNDDLTVTRLRHTTREAK